MTTGGRIRIDGPSRERNWWRDRGWSASFELEVARNSELMVGATNGGVIVRLPRLKGPQQYSHEAGSQT